VQETKGLFASFLFIVSCQLVKLIGNCTKTPKIVKPVLLETRSQALQLWLIESGLKLNNFKVI
jgi:hypothetical protein